MTSKKAIFVFPDLKRSIPLYGIIYTEHEHDREYELFVKCRTRIRFSLKLLNTANTNEHLCIFIPEMEIISTIFY